MDTRESNIAWWIAGILLVLLIIVGYLWLSERASLPTVLENGQSSIAAERDQIAKDCQGPDMNRTACNQDLSDLASILQEFSANVEQASTTASTTGAMAQ
jgi:hypothetical protein